MHSYETLKALVTDFAERDRSCTVQTYEASVGAHGVRLTVHPSTGKRTYTCSVYCERGTRAALEAELAKLSDRQASVYRTY
jgi:hypothetical protein